MASKNIRSAHTRVHGDIIPIIEELSRWRIRQTFRAMADVHCAAWWVATGIAGMACGVAELVHAKYDIFPWWTASAWAGLMVLFMVALTATWFRWVIASWADGAR